MSVGLGIRDWGLGFEAQGSGIFVPIMGNHMGEKMEDFTARSGFLVQGLLTGCW